MTPGFKLRFEKWKPDRRGGIAVLQNYIEIDTARPHPFRPRLMGRPRFYLVVVNEEGELYYDGEGTLRVRPAVTSGGLVRLRAEIPAYHYPQASGTETQYPEKRFDDETVEGSCRRVLPQVRPDVGR